MEILKVTDKRFKKYGKIVKNIDFSGLLEAMKDTPLPGGVVYEPSDESLEAAAKFSEIRDIFYGEMPIQIGYCNGHNHLLNAAEYHKCSEINVMQTDAILILGKEEDIEEDLTYDTAKMEAFLVPAGTAVEIYGTTLHYAPCSARKDAGFRVSIILPKGTNTELEAEHKAGGEDQLLTAKNKWLIGHKEGGLPEGTFLGLKCENLSV